MARRARGEPKPGEIGPPKPIGTRIKEFHVRRMKDMRGKWRRFEEPEEEAPPPRKLPYRLRPKPQRSY